MSGELARAVTPPAGSSGGMGFRQGVVVSWDPVTLSNTVLVDGETMVDLPMLGVAESTTLTAGAVVGLVTAGSTMAIMGRWVAPNTAEAADAISLLSSRTKTAIVDVQETTNSTTFTDLATAGPEVTIDIGPSGRALMFLSAKGGWSVVGADAASGARMSAELSGANTVTATSTWGAWIYTQYGSTSFSVVDASIGSAYVFEDLVPGSTTFTAKYRSDTVGVDVDFGRRTIVVIAL